MRFGDRAIPPVFETNAERKQESKDEDSRESDDRPRKGRRRDEEEEK